ncbi:MAG: acyl-CoA desaturase [Planctomycetes bacterium]|nr:acyl-CoA desaturase [Planctomycetota bacterium]
MSEATGSITPSRSVPSNLWICCLLVRRTGVLITVHVGALAVLLTEPAAIDWAVFVGMLFVRAYIVSIGYHRYFSHRCFKTSRIAQFIIGVICCTNMQNGPLWWAAVHRHHHRHSDDEEDYHSPVHGNLFWAHCGWIFSKIVEPDWSCIRELRRFPELVWLERFWLLPPILLGAAFWWFGGWTMLCLAFFGSAMINIHGTFTVNSLGHRIGSRRYPTKDSSRNSYVLAFLTCGDGWHNNHHHYPHSAQHGFFWWEIDGSFNVIRFFELLGLVWDVRRVPPHKLAPAKSA